MPDNVVKQAVHEAYVNNNKKDSSKFRKVLNILTSGEAGKAIRSIIPGAVVTAVGHPEVGVPMMMGPAVDHAVSKTSPYSNVGDAVVQTAGIHPGEKGYVPAAMAAEMIANPIYSGSTIRLLTQVASKLSPKPVVKKMVGEAKTGKVTKAEVEEDVEAMKHPRNRWWNEIAEDGEQDAKDWFASDHYNARNPDGELLSSEEMIDNINKTKKVEDVNAIYNGKPSPKNVDKDAYATYTKIKDEATIMYRKFVKHLRDAIRHESIHASDEGKDIFPEYRGIKAESPYYEDPPEVRARIQSVAADMESRGYNPNLESDVNEYVAFMNTQPSSAWYQDFRDLFGDYRVVGETKSAYSFAPGQLMKLITKGRAATPLILPIAIRSIDQKNKK